MSLGTPGASALFPTGQIRQQYGRDWGNYTTVAGMPNGSGNVLSAAQFRLEAGDKCYLSLSGGECEYLCVSPGTATGGDAVWVPSSGQGPWSSVLYVDNVRGSDTTGQRGNANRPFATIQAAMNAALTGDDLELAPQTFAITVSITIPSTVVRVAVNGTARGRLGGSTTFTLGTQITTTTVDLWNLGANLGLSLIAFQTMHMLATGHTAISADGSLYALGTFLSGGITLENVDLSGTTALLAKYVTGSILASGGHMGLTNFLLTSCLSVAFYSVDAFFASATVTYDYTDPLAPTSANACTFRSGTVLGGFTTSKLTWGGEAQVLVDQTSTIGGLVALNLGVSGAHVPAFCCAGNIGGGNSNVVDLGGSGTSEIPDTATVLTIDLRGTHFYQAGLISTGATVGPTTIRAKVGGAAGNFQTVKLDDTTTLPACTITANSKIHITGRGANWPQAVLTTPGADGDIIPASLAGTIDISAGGALAKTWVNLGYAGLIRTGVAPPVAFVTSAVQAADAVLPVAGKTTLGLTLTSTAQAGNVANWEALWP